MISLEVRFSGLAINDAILMRRHEQSYFVIFFKKILKKTRNMIFLSFYIAGRKEYLCSKLVTQLAYKLFSSLHHMHKCGIFHRDIKVRYVNSKDFPSLKVLIQIKLLKLITY